MLFIGMAAGLEGRTIGGTKRGAIFVEAHISGKRTFAGIEWDNGFLKSVILQQESEIIIAVKSGVGGKDAVMQGWMGLLEIQQNRLEGGRIPNFFINFGMVCAFSIFISGWAILKSSSKSSRWRTMPNPLATTAAFCA